MTHRNLRTADIGERWDDDFESAVIMAYLTGQWSCQKPQNNLPNINYGKGNSYPEGYYLPQLPPKIKSAPHLKQGLKRRNILKI